MELICLSWLRVQRWKLRVQYFEHLPKAEKFCFIWADCIQRRIWGILFAPGDKSSTRILRSGLPGSWQLPVGPNADMNRSSSISQEISTRLPLQNSPLLHFSVRDSARTKMNVIARAPHSLCHH